MGARLPDFPCRCEMRAHQELFPGHRELNAARTGHKGGMLRQTRDQRRSVLRERRELPNREGQIVTFGGERPFSSGRPPGKMIREHSSQASLATSPAVPASH